jgi:hypothetical protein
MFIHHECEGTLGQNDVTTIMLDYLKSNLMANPSEIWLFSGGCQGQNKKSIMLQIAHSLVHIVKIVKVVTRVFLLRVQILFIMQWQLPKYWRA